MTQTTLTRTKRAELEGQQFDKDALRVGRHPVMELKDAFTSRSTPGNLIRARNYLTIVIDVSDKQDGSRTVQWLSCNLCNRIGHSVAVIESHITSDHANGSRKAGAGDVAEMATAGDPVPAAVPAQRTGEPEPSGEDEGEGERRREQHKFMENAKKTRRRWNELRREAEREGRKLTKVEAAQRMGITREALARRLAATEDTARKTYNTATPQETKAAYDALIAAEGPLTLKEAGEKLGMHSATLSRRLREAGQDGDREATLTEAVQAVQVDGRPAVPVQAVPNPAFVAPDEQDDEQDDGEPEPTGVIDPAREERITATVELVVELSQSRAEWMHRAKTYQRERDEARRERDVAVQRVESVHKALGLPWPAEG